MNGKSANGADSADRRTIAVDTQYGAGSGTSIESDACSVPSKSRSRIWERPSTRSIALLLALAALLAALRLALPYWVRDTLNDRLDKVGQYHGHLEDVDVHLWRGAYVIRDLVFRKSVGKIPVPFVKAPIIDISISWREIFRGAIVGEVVFERPEVNFVDGLGSTNGQSGRGVDWRETLEGLVPIKLNEVRVRDGTVAFRAFNTHPPVDMNATNFDAIIVNLTNVRGEGGRRVAKLVAEADVLGRAPLKSEASFDPFGSLDDFAFNVRVTNIEATRLNPLLQAYARLDVVSGRGDFVMELEATQGALKGYAKPLFQDIEVLSWKQDVEKQKDNPLRLVWEALAGGVIAIFKNHPADQFATRIPISGNLKDPDLNRWDALVAVLHNAFVEAFKPVLERRSGG